MLKKTNDRIDFSVDSFMAQVGADNPLGYFIQPMDTDDCPNQQFEGITGSGANVTVTIKGLLILIDFTFGSFPVQSIEEELFIRAHFEKMMGMQGLFFVSGNNHLIISFNKCASILETDLAREVFQKTIEAVPKISALLFQYDNFIPFACKQVEDLK